MESLTYLIYMYMHERLCTMNNLQIQFRLRHLYFVFDLCLF